MPKYCPTCGNASDKVAFYGNFCENCTREKFAKGLPIELEMFVCKRCGKIKAGGAFVPPNSYNIELALAKPLGKYVVDLLGYEDGKARLRVSDETEYGPISAEITVNVVNKKQLCEMCYKKACSYHEAVLQLRGNNQKISKFVHKITEYFDSHNEFVAKVENDPHGVNMFMSNKRLAASFISKSGLKANVSFTLAGVKKGRRVYKNTYALRFENEDVHL